MTDTRGQRRLAAILVADVVGYSRMMEADEAGTLAALKDRRTTILEPIIKRHGGRVVKFMGDGVLVEFASAVNAVKGALELQEKFAASNENLPEERRIILRIGINLGDVVGEGSDIFGDGVNIAARLEALAHPGSICVSAKVHDEVRGKTGATFDDMGEQVLKNIAQPLRVYRITAPSRPQFPTAKSAAKDRISIAALPFVNMSGDAEMEYFADGLSNDILTALSRFNKLSVIARTSSFAYKGKTHDIKKIAAELEADYILEGSVRRSGNRLRVTAQLIDASNGAHLWAEKFDGSVDEVFDIQDHITRSVAAATDNCIFTIVERSQWARDQIGATAYRLAAQANANLYQMTPKSLAEAAALAEQAVSLDPDSAYAHRMRAGALILRLATGVIPHSPENVQKALALATEGVRRADMDENSHLQMAEALGEAGRFEEAAAECDVALEINPSATALLGDKGEYLTFLGRPDEAIALCEQALRFDPRDSLSYWWENSIATAHLISGDTARALEMSRRVAMRKPDYIRAGIIWAASAGLLGQMAEAQEALRHCLDRAPDLALSNVMPHYLPTFRRTPDRELLIRGLQHAGLPP